MMATSIIKEGNQIVHRQTKVRKTLSALFAKNNNPYSVAQILQYLSDNGLHPNKTTVYRELDYLLARESIREVKFGDRKIRFESSLQSHHHHLICIKCDSINDIKLLTELDFEEKIIEKENKFKVLSHSLEFFGICKKCLP